MPVNGEKQNAHGKNIKSPGYFRLECMVRVKYDNTYFSQFRPTDPQIQAMVNQQIQWYPGHMHKAGKAITARLRQVDVCIEMLDARIPYSSTNPMLAALRGNKPCLKILSKSDLASPHLNEVWRLHYVSGQHTEVLVTDARKAQGIRHIPALCRQLYDASRSSKPIIMAMVMGIPNVGKSTMVNGLAGRAAARTGDQPALTTVQQIIEIEPGFVVLDTPGMLWPKVENPNSGFRLAVTGAIRDTGITHAEIAGFAAAFFMQNHPHRLARRYRLESMPDDGEAVIFAVGRRRGCLGKGGRVDMDRAAKVFLGDVRGGRLGGFTMETPRVMAAELQQVEQGRLEKTGKNRHGRKTGRFPAPGAQ